MQTMGFILPVYGQYDYARRAAESFMRSTHCVRPDIILVDDASPEGAEAFAKLVDDVNPAKYFRFPSNGGLTRSWNAGIQMGSFYDYLICGNSDIVFANGWDYNVLHALTSYDLVGPITNASGWGTPRQNVTFHDISYQLSDDQKSIDDTQHRLDCLSLNPIQELRPMSAAYAQQGVSIMIPEMLNGFCMVAKADTWLSGSYDRNHVFNPANKMTENETELQMRWALMGRRSAIARSFVFHYRAITRGDKALCKGAFRGTPSAV